MNKKENIIKMYLENYKIKDIIKETNVSLQYIYFVLRDNNIPRNRQLPKKNVLDAIKYFKKHKTNKAKAIRKFNTTRPTFNRNLDLYGDNI